MLAANIGISKIYSAGLTARTILIALLHSAYRSFLASTSADQKVSVASQTVSNNK
jgi:hypothetical protein